MRLLQKFTTITFICVIMTKRVIDCISKYTTPCAIVKNSRIKFTQSSKLKS